MASLVAATPGPVGRTWSLIQDPMYPRNFILTDGTMDEAHRFIGANIKTSLPGLADCQAQRIGDMVKDMVGADVGLQNSIITNVIIPAYLAVGVQLSETEAQRYYAFLMTSKASSQAQLKPYITEGIFARSSVTRKGICDVAYIAPESGDKGAPFSTRYDPSDLPAVRNINTAAMQTDPSSTNAGSGYVVWPPIGDTVLYPAECLNRLGLLPGLMWSAKTEGDNSFLYEISKPMMDGRHETLNFANNIPGIPGIPDEIREGNRNRIGRFSVRLDPDNALQSSIYKEEGDLMQILEFLSWYFAGDVYKQDAVPIDSNGNRKESVMVTTDEIVFMICCDLGIPCIYTGGKSVDPETGIHISGYGAYKFYNPVLDPSIAFKNKIMNIFNNKKGINDIQIQLLKDIQWKDRGNKSIYYYKQGGRTSGMRVCFRPSLDKIGEYNAHIEGLIAGITQKNAELEILKGLAISNITMEMGIAAMDDDYNADTNIEETIANFDRDSGPLLTPLYVDKAKSPTSVDTDVISIVHNCIDVGLCGKLTSLSSGRAGGGKLTGGNDFDIEEWTALQTEYDNKYPNNLLYNSEVHREYFISKIHITNSEYNALILIFAGFHENIKLYLFDKIKNSNTDDEAISAAKLKYAAYSARSICVSIYTHYAYLVSLINPNLLPKHVVDYDFNINIQYLCKHDLLYTAIKRTLTLIGIQIEDDKPPPFIFGFFSHTSNYIVDKDGYIDSKYIPTATENMILGMLIFVAPDKSYNALRTQRDEDAAAAQAAEMPSRYPGKVPWPLSREVSDPYPALLTPPPREAWPLKASTVPFTVYTGEQKLPPPPTLFGREVSFEPNKVNRPLKGPSTFKSKLEDPSRRDLKTQSSADPEKTKDKLNKATTIERREANQLKLAQRRGLRGGGKKRTKKNKRSKTQKSKSKKNKTKRKTI
jgi:hypothetical protein